MTHSDPVRPARGRRDRDVGTLVGEAIAGGDVAGWFEPLYDQADGDIARVPWAHGLPRDLFNSWLRTREPVGEGRSALVVGCGLGDDAEALAACGFEVAAFDVSSTAISWARRRFPDSSVTYRVADLFGPPDAWRGAFDVVAENFTIQSLPAPVREDTITRIASFVAPGGVVAVTALVRDPGIDVGGPPWPLTPDELDGFERAGLVEVFAVDTDLGDSPVHAAVREYHLS